MHKSLAALNLYETMVFNPKRHTFEDVTQVNSLGTGPKKLSLPYFKLLVEDRIKKG